MRKNIAQRLLDTPVLDFGNQISCLTFDSLFARVSFTKAQGQWEKHVEVLRKFYRKTEERTGKDASSLMWSRLIANDARTFPPKPVALTAYGARNEQLLDELAVNFKRQANWLFVTGFEAYEEYLKTIYAALGYLDRSFWTCVDFGDIPADGINRLRPDWFRRRIKEQRARITPDRILGNIRRNLPTLTEKEHLPPLDLRMWVGLSALFRHAIVHNRAHIPREGLWEAIAKHTGYSFSGTSKETRMRRHNIYEHLIPDGDDYVISMVDEKGLDSRGPRLDGPLHRMLNRLADHGLLVYALLAERFGFTPYWEKDKMPPPEN